ncbi:hypothetical protein KR222_003641, partial [Zaprionus bogoriensis]
WRRLRLLSTKMTIRQAVTVILLLGSIALAANATIADREGGDWMAPLQREGYDTKELKNQVKNGQVTTYDLGTPTFQILNPEDQPEFITEDQPHYHEMLRRLTSSANASDTIDVGMPSASTSLSVSVSASASASPDDTTIAEPRYPRGRRLRRPVWEKLRKRSFPQANASNQQPEDEVDAKPEDEVDEVQSFDKQTPPPKVQIFAGAKPFQKLIANLS